MVAMNTPGVYVQELDMSDIVPSQSSSVTAFAGNFTKGVASVYARVTSVDELIENYGYPTDDNYNDWYQAYNFLQYGNNLLVSRAINENGQGTPTKSTFVETYNNSGYGVDTFGSSFYGQGSTDEIVIVSSLEELKKGDVIGFSNNVVNSINTQKTLRYMIVDVSTTVVDNETVYALRLDRELALPSVATSETVTEWYEENNKIFIITSHYNGTAEALVNDEHNDVNLTWKVSAVKYKDYIDDELVNVKKLTPYNTVISVPKRLNGTTYVSQENITLDDDTHAYTFDVEGSDIIDSGVLFNTNRQILSDNDFDLKFSSLQFATRNTKLKFFSKTPGVYDARYKIAIALPRDFSVNDKQHIGNHCTRYAYDGLSVDSFFDYAPADNSAQIGVFIYDTYEGLVKESFICSLDPNELDSYNNSLYIEKVINRQSNCVYVKCNDDLPITQSITVDVYDDFGNTTGETETIIVPNVCSYTLVCDINDNYVGHLLSLSCASDSTIQNDDLENAYDVFSNKDELDVDIVIANEIDNGLSAKNLAEKRADCIAFMCIPYEDETIGILTVGKKTTDATSNIVKYRNKINYNSMFVSLVANYKYQYDRYNDTYRWINLAGDVAGLRAQTTENYDTWWASAGLNRGQIKNVQKLAYMPNKTQQGTLYNNGINPVVAFSGDGTVLWGQKTMLTKSSSFDRVNVRGLFNTLERALAKMSRYQVMEFNDTFTRNNVIAKISPYLETVKSGRGITDYKVVCDTTNNTPDIISRNQLIVDVYIKPNYVAEFILLRFTNVGVNDFNTVVTTA